MILTPKISLRLLACLTLGISSIALMEPHKAYACEQCSEWSEDVYNEMKDHEDWMINEWWNDYFKPDLEKLSSTVRNAIMMNSITFGMAQDGQNLMNSMRAVEESNVSTMKNMAPSDTICKFGTLSRSLSLSQGTAVTTQIVLGERSQDRQLGHKDFASQDGSQGDFNSRIKAFKDNFCDPADFASALTGICSASAGKDTRQNNDVNFTRAIDAKKTLDIDFTSGAGGGKPDEEDVIALANNLYANEVFDRIELSALANTQEDDAQSAYINQRAIVAKRSVAENSFNALVGQKAAGGDASKTYMIEALKKLGLSATDATKYLGNKPSYDAQMEVMTKKLYQDPAFYANLMDGPANVNRQYAALQSIGLMQRRDIYETIQRSEMLLSLLLEMEVSRYQSEIQGRTK